MNFKNLSDGALHLRLKSLIQNERQILAEILRHLEEVERRKLFSDHNCSSLFEYAVRQLGYSEGQAHRRIQAMRLIRELPEVEEKIASGSLNLSNISQAQSFFNELKKQTTEDSLVKEEKLKVLAQLENKSVREGQKELLKMRPEAALPKDKERIVTETQTEVRFLMDEQLKEKLEEVRALLGPKGLQLNYGELFTQMAELSLSGLKAKKFGKKRSQSVKASDPQTITSSSPQPAVSLSTPKVGDRKKAFVKHRYIPKKLRFEVWQRDEGRCQICSGKRNLNFDHIRPVALGGRSEEANLRLLCFHCNQRESIKVFGYFDCERIVT